MREIKRLLVANRSEVAIRVFRAAAELGIQTVAIYSEQDRLALHRYKADEAYLIGNGLGPVEAYLSIDEVLRVAREARVDAIHPGYGFLAENPDFAERCEQAGIIFIGPTPDTMRALGDKIAARNIAKLAEAPILPATEALPADVDAVRAAAEKIGYPLMLKASWGGGGRGMRQVFTEADLIQVVSVARAEAAATFGRDEIYLEKLVTNARHIEVQLLGDKHGQLFHLFERDCSIQRRHQKVLERAPAPYITQKVREALCDAALRIGRAVDYVGAGTVEFLLDADTDDFYFIEVNPRIQVEHTVTEVVTGLDIVKAQILVAKGGRLGNIDETGVPPQAEIQLDGHALQCRITTEDPENNFTPDYGRITSHRGAFGFGVRVDGGTAYSGAVVSPYYDSLLEKVTAWARSPEEAAARMQRVLREYRVRGVATNLAFLSAILDHPRFKDGTYSTRFIDECPELMQAARGQDRASKLLNYIGEVTVNGHPDVTDRARPVVKTAIPVAPNLTPVAPLVSPRSLMASGGPDAVVDWMKHRPLPMVTDTTMRDAHQSLLATRMRTADIVRIAGAYGDALPDLFSLECWGGATFDVAMRFLHEDPWERLETVRQNSPHALLQMLLRGANGVGYRNYPDNVVRFFIAQAAQAGVDVFRVFDCFNWVENMRVAIDAIREEGKLAQGAICYTGDILDPKRSKYNLRYYVDRARELSDAGCQLIAIKDMAGLLKPAAARALVKALKDEIGQPIQLHTHDTSGTSAATVLAALEAGVDGFDAAMDSLSGCTSQPCLGSIVEALRGGERDTGLDPDSVRAISRYWEDVRQHYVAFESDLRSGASEVYEHELPGGQFTNLREQARGVGLGARWSEVAAAYRQANFMLGDVIKVTPSSKVVGDLALMMVSSNISTADIMNPDREIDFPQSVVEMLRGELGQPPGGWPAPLLDKVLKGQPTLTERPGLSLAPIDLEAARADFAQRTGQPLDDRRLASALMYPQVYEAFAQAQRRFGPVSTLPTHTFFYGMEPGSEVVVDIERGKTVVIALRALSSPDDEGVVQVFFELNGQPRTVFIQDTSRADAGAKRQQADPNTPGHVGAPMSGIVSQILVTEGQHVDAGQALLSLEAMKMVLQVTAHRPARVTRILTSPGAPVDTGQLLVELAVEAPVPA